MKLWGSFTSPYVRKICAMLEYHQLPYEFLPVQGNAFNAQSAHNLVNPLGKVPTLQTDDGVWLCDSSVIAEYLDSIGNSPKLYPQGEKRFVELNTVALAHGILANTTELMLPEKMFRAEEFWWKERHQQVFERNQRSLKALWEQIQPYGTELNLMTLSAACVVDYFLFRDEIIGMANTLKELGFDAWNEAMKAQHPCLMNTQPRKN